MKTIALLAAALLMPVLALAAPPQSTSSQHSQRDKPRFGLGGSVRSGDAAVYVPIELNPDWRLEPYFAWSETETTTGGVTVKAETHQLGAGGFFRLDVIERVQGYVGGRLSFVEMETGGSDLDGFRAEPTVGLEFWATDRFSVALEAFLYREDLDGTVGGVAAESEATGSDTRLLVRFFP